MKRQVECDECGATFDVPATQICGSCGARGKLRPVVLDRDGHLEQVARCAILELEVAINALRAVGYSRIPLDRAVKAHAELVEELRAAPARRSEGAGV